MKFNMEYRTKELVKWFLPFYLFTFFRFCTGVCRGEHR